MCALLVSIYFIVAWVLPHEQSTKRKHSQYTLAIVVASALGVCCMDYILDYILNFTYCILFLDSYTFPCATLRKDNLYLIKLPMWDIMQAESNFVSHDWCYPFQSQTCGVTLNDGYSFATPNHNGISNNYCSTTQSSRKRFV